MPVPSGAGRAVVAGLRRRGWLPDSEVGLRLAALALLCLVAWLAEPRFGSFRNVMNVLRQASILGLAAFGQAFVIISGGVDISTGALVALSGVVAAMVAGSAGTLAGIAAGLASGAFFGFLNGVSVARLRVQPVIATVGMLNFLRGLGFLLTGAQPVLNVPASFVVLGNRYLGAIPYPVLLALAVLLLGQYVLSQLPAGREMYAVGSNEEAAALSGIDVKRVRLYAFTLAGACAALSGVVLASRFNSGQPTAGQFMELEAIAAVVLGGTALGGGVGGLWRTAIGALMMAVISNGMNLAGVSPYTQQVALGAIIVLAVGLDSLRTGRNPLRALFGRQARPSQP